ncbi:hypothetical protein IFR05_002963 [Cadophora sp. M221]|nr:hypothetical protein IFR05_002963 [Cadophora sp. M221]
MAEISIGVVSLGIQVCQGLLQYYGSWKDSRKDVAAMCTSVESLSSTLTILEKTITGASTPDKNTQKCIEACSLSIEQLQKKLSKVQKVPGDKLSTQIHDHGRRLLYPFRESTLVKLKEIVADIRSNLCLAVDTIHLQMTVDMSQQVGYLATHITNRHKDLQSRTVIDWLSPLNFHETQVDTLSRRQSGTCEWIFDTPEYQAWMEGGSQILWCWGQPGAGKTILASTIIDRLLTGLMPSNVAVAFVYCNYKERRAQNFPALIASLVQQLVQCSDSVPEDVRLLFEQCRSKNTSPTVGQVTGMFRSLLASFKRTFIVVDGLDECSGTDETRSNLIKLLNSLPIQVGIICISRRLGDIEEGFRTASRLEVRASQEDIEVFLRSQILGSDRLRSFCESSEHLQDTIIEKLVKNAKGMFLLAKLHVESLKTKTSSKQVRKALKKLPKELDVVYDDAMERIRGQHEEEVKLAMRLLSWVTHALTPLRVAELQHAIAVMDFEQDDTTISDEDLPTEAMMITVCGGLTVVDYESQIFRLVHYTTEEYFSKSREAVFPEAQTEITRCCLRYLSIDWFSEVDVDLDDDLQPPVDPELLNYASQNWGHHARGTVESQLREDIVHFLSDETQLSRIRHTRKLPDDDNIESGIVEAAEFGLSTIVCKFLLSGTGVNTRGNRERTALQAAVSGGHETLVRVLLEHGADLEKNDLHGASALSEAILSNQLNMVRLLVENRACIEAIDYHRRQETALQKAIQCAPVSDLLLDSAYLADDRDIEQKFQSEGSMNGSAFGIIQYLLDQGADLESRDYFQRTALSIATKRGSESLVALLLGKGARINVQDIDGMTPLHMSAERGHLGLVNLLLENGADIEALESRGRTAYFIAAEKGYRRMFEEFLKVKPDAASHMKFAGSTPLHRAIQLGDDTLASLFADKTTDINATDRNGETAFFVATVRGNATIIHLLAEKGACIDAPDSRGQTALHVATKYRYGTRVRWTQPTQETVLVLLNLGANVNTKNPAGETPLHAAASNGRYAVSEMLVSAGSDISIRDDSGNTALEAAIQAKGDCIRCKFPQMHDCGHPKIIKMLSVATNGPVQAKTE